jgi:hypothetical protein
MAPLSIKITPATANPGVISGVRGNFPGVSVAVSMSTKNARYGRVFHTVECRIVVD